MMTATQARAAAAGCQRDLDYWDAEARAAAAAGHWRKEQRFARYIGACAAWRDAFLDDARLAEQLEAAAGTPAK